MQQINLHKTKLVALLEAAFAFIALFLTWTTETLTAGGQQGGGGFDLRNFGGQAGFNQMNNMMNQATQNGFNSWGYLTLVGIIGVFIVTLFMGDKTKDYDKQTKNLVLLSFAAIAAGAIIYYLRLNSVSKEVAMVAQQRMGAIYSAKAGMGLWTALLAGLIGLAWVTGLMNKLGTPAAAPATTTTTTEIPPTTTNTP